MLVPYTIGIISVTYPINPLIKPKHIELKQLSLHHAIFFPCAAILGLFLIITIASFGLLLCFIISIPILFPAASLGGITVWLVQKHKKYAPLFIAVTLFLPFSLSPVEAQFDKERETVYTLTSIQIEADVAAVWAEIASVDPITEDEHRFNWTHKVGLPRPVAATLSHHGVGGVRNASFENGLHFDEEIIEWEEHQRIRFTIEETSQTLLPAPLDLIDGETFDVVEGEYAIELLEDGTVMLHLSSEHFLTTRFNRYGAFWTDLLMRNLQNYILEIVKERAEAKYSDMVYGSELISGFLWSTIVSTLNAISAPETADRKLSIVTSAGSSSPASSPLTNASCITS